jgi:hypothetical protein
MLILATFIYLLLFNKVDLRMYAGLVKKG